VNYGLSLDEIFHCQAPVQQFIIDEENLPIAEKKRTAERTHTNKNKKAGHAARSLCDWQSSLGIIAIPSEMPLQIIVIVSQQLDRSFGAEAEQSRPIHIEVIHLQILL